MKKILAVALALALAMLIPSFAVADFDLAGMSYDELVALKDQINLAIWNSQEWQEVEVPKGIWIVGEDIPAGKWTIKHTDGVTATNVAWGDTLTDSGADLAYGTELREQEVLFDPDNKYYDKGDPTEVTWELKDGQYIYVEDGIATFTPYSGKPSLGFK